MPSTLLPAAPARTPAPYLGGKRNLAQRICARLEAIPHATYVEPFVGMGGVFLRRPFRARAEVINDISTDVANLFRVLQRHYVALMDMLRWQLTSRAEFERLLSCTADTLTDLERAARFLYLQRTAFGGKVSGRNFGVAPGVPARFDVTKLAAVLEEVHERLAGVVIERLPYAELIARYDRPDTLFYLDPPYWGCERDYGPGVFDRADFERLAEILAGIRGRFLLSLNDTPGVREVFGSFEIEAVETTYGISGRPQRAGEVLISS
ncbi:MAG: DNA adenine methylase [Gammaproteobacteria bacterium]